ncbi:MAG: pyrimidine 5'-nucleotidase [Sphingomonadaceae bacterium]
MDAALDHIDTWIFDLDNTLYPSNCNLFALIDDRMGRYIARRFGVDRQEAHRIQKQYFYNHGTTLSGLMTEHDVDPYEFLDFVHDIEMDRITPNPSLAAAIDALPGRAFIFTNGDAPYARRVLDRLGLGSCFDGLFDIHDSGYAPKPHAACYDKMCDTLNVEPNRALFVEDMARNLRPAKALGMATVWINNGSDYGAADACPSFIDYETHEVGDWLATYTRKAAA